MDENGLFAEPQFAGLPVLPHAPRPTPGDPIFNGVVYEADDPAVVRDLIGDPHLVPRAAAHDGSGRPRVVFWQLRAHRPG